MGVEYAKGFQATHVVLGRYVFLYSNITLLWIIITELIRKNDRKLGRELRYFMGHLSFGISRVKSDSSIEIVRPSQPQVEQVAKRGELTSNTKNSTLITTYFSLCVCVCVDECAKNCISLKVHGKSGESTTSYVLFVETQDRGTVQGRNSLMLSCSLQQMDSAHRI